MLKIYVCIGSCCYMKGSYFVKKTFEELISEYGLEDYVTVKGSFCLGNCDQDICVKIDGSYIEGVIPENAAEIFNLFVLNKVTALCS